MKETPIQKLLREYEDRICGKFKPDQRFYSRVGVNPKRFGLLLIGKKEPYATECAKLAKFFGIELHDLLEMYRDFDPQKYNLKNRAGEGGEGE